MSSRNYVVGAVTDKMRAAVAKGDFLDAQNMEAFISSLEDMTDEEYAEISSLETPGLISKTTQEERTPTCLYSTVKSLS